MASLIHADIFFFISTIALIIIAATLIVVIVYVISILDDLKKITKKVRKESEEVIDDLHTLRQHIKTEGLSIRYISSFFRRLLKRKKGD